MRRWVSIIALAALGAAAAPPAWLYPFDPPKTPPIRDAKVKRSLPGSTQRLTEAQYRDLFHAADWYPGDHPAMPPLVREGRPPELRACGTCHLPTGGGRPENASLAGLPAAYIVAQVKAFAAGTRTNSAHNPSLMASTARAAGSAPQLAEAARYFASLKPRRFGRVVEAARIPRVQLAINLWHYADGGGSKPLGNRLIEVPDDHARHEMRDPRLGYTAYVPPGSIARGAALARNWGGGRYACATCHGAGLHGGIGPRLAGRSPTYLMRQLHDFQSGSRGGPASTQMAQVVKGMRLSDMIALAAYSGQQQP